MKTYDYIISFEKPDYRWVDRMSQFMLILAVSVFIYFIAVFVFTVYSALLLILGIGIAVTIYLVYRKEKKGLSAYYRFALLLAAAGWYVLPQGKWLALIYLIAAILEKQVKFPQEVAFDENEIVFNTLPKKIHRWSELNAVILKDGMLTIDFKNNRLIQRRIESSSTAREEQEFNTFCADKLNAKS